MYKIQLFLLIIILSAYAKNILKDIEIFGSYGNLNIKESKYIDDFIDQPKFDSIRSFPFKSYSLDVETSIYSIGMLKGINKWINIGLKCKYYNLFYIDNMIIKGMYIIDTIINSNEITYLAKNEVLNQRYEIDVHNILIFNNFDLIKIKRDPYNSIVLGCSSDLGISLHNVNIDKKYYENKLEYLYIYELLINKTIVDYVSGNIINNKRESELYLDYCINLTLYCKFNFGYFFVKGDVIYSINNEDNMFLEGSLGYRF